MNKREENLVRILYEKKNIFVLVREMAEHENCSEKTVRNSLDRLDAYLAKFSDDLKLERKKGKGICLKIREGSKLTLNHILDSDHVSEDKLTNDERKFDLTYTLLISTKPVTLKKLAQKYYVNKKIIADDLKDIGKQLERYDLKIVSKQKVGNFVEGLEKDKREALSRIIKNLGEFNKTKSILKSIFMPYEIDIVNKSIMDLQDDINASFTDESISALTIHILFMIKRIKLDQFIMLSESEKKLVKSKIQYSWAVELAKSLENVFSIKFPEDEIVYMAINLLGIKYTNGSNMEMGNFIEHSDSSIIDILIGMLLDDLENVEDDVSFKSDEVLKQALRLHLYASLNRINYGLPLENPILDKIKQMNPYLYYEILDIVDRFNARYKMHIPREEVAYITIHFLASIERNRKDAGKKYSAVIVCHLGIGISNYLQIKLEKIFPWIDFKGSISLKEVRRYAKNNSVSFIFSSVDIDEPGIDYIKISPIIDKADEANIKEAVNKRIAGMESKRNGKIDKFIYKKFIFLKKDMKNKIEVIRFIADKLQSSGRIDDAFLDSVLKRENIDSTEIGNLLAIPHGDADHIISSTISILTLKKPIIWDKEQVQIVFFLAVKKEDYSKDNTMRNFFRCLNNIITSRETIDKLIKENDVGCFLKSIKDNAISSGAN